MLLSFQDEDARKSASCRFFNLESCVVGCVTGLLHAMHNRRIMITVTSHQSWKGCSEGGCVDCILIPLFMWFGF